MRKAALLVVSVILLSILHPIPRTDHGPLTQCMPIPTDEFQPSASSGIQINLDSYVVVELQGASLPAQGGLLVQVMQSRGIVTELVTVNDVLATPTLVTDPTVIVLDGSLGSDNGTAVPDSFIQTLIRSGASVILIGRAAWMLHRLRGRGPPSATAPLSVHLHPNPAYLGAVFLSYPESVTLDSLLTSEEGIILPEDPVQTEHSRLVELTGRTTQAALPALRHDSWPLEVFLFGPENPALLTDDGVGLLINTLACATSLRESPTTLTLESTQATVSEPLAGGLSYIHEPMLRSAYYSVHSARSLLGGAAWATWRTEHASLLADLLTRLRVNLGTEAGFLDSVTEGVVSLTSTSMGLWLISAMELEFQFDVTLLVAYISSRQDAEGGFASDMTMTFHATEALYESTALSLIDTSTLEDWLRSCVVDGSKTSDPALWGGIAANPSSSTPSNTYAVQFLESLGFLGKAHTDPVKMTEWILETAVDDGSYNDRITPGQMVTIATASALTSMSMMGTLTTQNRADGLTWLSANQLNSGGFGMMDSQSDSVGKGGETHAVASCIKELGETGGSIASGILTYLADVETPLGFEAMEPVPSLMWSYWNGLASRLSHAKGSVDYDMLEQYIDSFSSIYQQYPAITAILPPEYTTGVYGQKSVWTNLFGAGLLEAAGLEPSPSDVSQISTYMSFCQDPSGHYRSSMITSAPHIQYTVAAVEALHLIDSLDTIVYRGELETAILNEYSSGQWSTAGWTLPPFEGDQSAIDCLCTRAALRLGIVTPAMALEIQSSIESRVQYSDLWALSRDVAVLALLNSSFSVNLASVNESSVLSALEPSFTDGWYNSTVRWQPVYTAGVLEMISTLGLRPLLSNAKGAALDAAVPPTAYTGSDMSVGITVGSTTLTHTVFVHAYDTWFRYDDVSNSDTLTVPVLPQLGPSKISVMLWDWGDSRAYDGGQTEVRSVIEGTLDKMTSDTLLGEPINGTIAWWLSGGSDAGPCELGFRVANTTYSEEWTSTEVSTYAFLIPTDSFAIGTYNLTVTVNRTYCIPLVLWSQVSIQHPEPTYLSSTPLVEGYLGSTFLIPWSLHLESNDSYVPGQTVSLDITDSAYQTAHTDSAVSTLGASSFLWNATVRGNYTYVLTFSGNGTLQPSSAQGLIHVYDSAHIAIDLDQQPLAPGPNTVLIQLLDTEQTPVYGASIHTVVTLEGITILDSWDTTAVDGRVSLPVTLTRPGLLDILITLQEQLWLRESSNQSQWNVLGVTSITLDLPTVPIGQGTTVGIRATLLDWSGTALPGEDVTISVLWPNGTFIESAVRTTGSDGAVILAHQFVRVGDFIVNATYTGAGLNDRSTVSIVQRVIVTPTVLLSHEPTSLLGDSVNLTVHLLDALGQYCSGRLVTVTVVIDSVTALNEQVVTQNGPTVFVWNPASKGLATITATHTGDAFYLSNSTASSMSVLEVVFGDLDLSVSTLDLFQTARLTYTLVSTSPYGAVVAFKVLGIDLVPLWTQEASTNASGIAHVDYYADHSHGVLTVTAAPKNNQFMVGGDTSSQFTVMTACNVVTTLDPPPATAGVPLSITVQATDDLGLPIDGLNLRVYVYKPYDTLVLSQTVTVVDGLAVVAFTPADWGLHWVRVTSSGSVSVYSFDATKEAHTVHSPTFIDLCLSGDILEVDTELTVTAQITELHDDPLSAVTLRLYLDGPGTIGPYDLLTNDTGHIVWTDVVPVVGQWQVHVEFDGIGVYLPSSATDEVNVRLGTEIEVVVTSSGDVVAGQSPLAVTVLLTDTADSPLEGRTVYWDAYHDSLGLVTSGSLVQQSHSPEPLNITFPVMGNYSLVFSFKGTASYHASNTALRQWVMGTSQVAISGPASTDRSEDSSIIVHVLDENGDPILLSELSLLMELGGSFGVVDHTNRTTWDAADLSLSTLGLQTGEYSLNITVLESSERLGSAILYRFNVTTVTALVENFRDLPGLVAEEHSVELSLIDSLSLPVLDVVLWVSVYDPTGREIYGSLLTERTAVNSPDGTIAVSWTPSLTGNYTLLVSYDGDGWKAITGVTIVVLTRRVTVLEIQGEMTATYPEQVELTATLSGGIGRISGATLQILDLLDGEIAFEDWQVTSVRGSVTFDLGALLGGRHNISIAYAGSDQFAPCQVQTLVTVYPLVEVSVDGQLAVGMNSTVTVTIDVQGVSPDWEGHLRVLVLAPSGGFLQNLSLSAVSGFESEIHLVPAFEGVYQLNVTLTGLPTGEPMTSLHAVIATVPPLEIPLDAGTGSVAGGGAIVSIVGALLWRKKESLLALPVEWEG